MRTLYGSTSWRRVLALVLVFVMMVSTMGTSGYSVFAEDLVETNEEVTVAEPEANVPEVTEDIQGPSPGEEESEAVVDPATDAEPVTDAELVEASEEDEEPAEDAETVPGLVEGTEEGTDAELVEENAETVPEPVEGTEEGADAELVEETEETEPVEPAEDTLISEAAKVIEEDDGEAVAELEMETVAEPVEATEEAVEEAIEELPEEVLPEGTTSFEPVKFDDAIVMITADPYTFPDDTTVVVEEVPIGRTVLKAIDGVVNAVPIKAYDITFFDASGTDIQPAKPVKISIESIDLPEVDNLQILHIDDNGRKVDIVEGVEETESGFEFDAAHFSIYVIMDGENQTFRRTYKFEDINANGEYVSYEFYNKAGEKVDNQIIKNGDELEPVGTPYHAGFNFVGWYLWNKDAKEFGDAVSFETPISMELAEDEEVIIRAKYDGVFYIHFNENEKTSNEKIILTTCVVPATEAYPIDDIEAPIPSAGKIFIGWRTADSETVLDSPYTPTANTELYPVFTDGYWLRFSGNGRGASYTEAISVTSVQDLSTVTQPEAPTREGYTFDNWYTDEDGGDVFLWSGTLSEDTMVYAHWIPKTNVAYTVFYWLENANDDNYAYLTSKSMTGTAGAQTAAAELTNQDKNSFTNVNWNGFELQEIRQVEIDGDGSTIANVYYDRKYITLTFHNPSETTTYEESADGTYYKVTLSGAGYFGTFYYKSGNDDYTAINTNIYYKYRNEGPLAYVSGDTFTVYTRGGWGPWSSYSVANGVTASITKYNATSDYPKVITEKYGADIHEKWPLNPDGESKWYLRNSSESTYTLMVNTMPVADKDYYYITQNGRYVLRTVYKTQDLDNLRSFSEYESVSYRSNRSAYKTVDDYTGIQGFSINAHSASDAEDIRSDDSGDPNATYNPAYPTSPSIGTNYSEGEHNGDTYTLTFYYLRNQYDIKFISKGVEVKKIEGVYYEADITGKVPTDYVVDVTEATIDGVPCTFQGWYDNEDCGGYPYEFSTMPAKDLLLYAKWAPAWYIVTVDPNGGVLNGNQSAFPPDAVPQSTWFWAEYGELVGEYDTTRDYTPDENGSFYYHKSIHPNDSTYDRLAYYTTDASKSTDNGKHYKYEPGAYVFEGWYELNVNGEPMDTPYDFQAGVSHNITIQAQWRKAGAYTVAYQGVVDGIGGNAPTDNAYYADKAVITVPGAPSGITAMYIFDGWIVVDASGTAVDDKIYQPGDKLTLNAEWADSSKVIHIQAHYTKVDESSDPVGITKLVLDANGGETSIINGTFKDENGKLSPVTVVDNVVTYSNLPLNQKFALADVNNKFTKEGFKLKGWNHEKAAADAGTVEYGVDKVYTLGVDNEDPADNTLYAVWGKTYKVTYAYSGDVPDNPPTLPAAVSYEEGETVAIADTPDAVEGYTFKGWTITSPEGTTVSANGEFDMPEDDVIITGEWEENAPPVVDTYTVEYLPGDHGAFTAGVTGKTTFSSLSAGEDTPVFDGEVDSKGNPAGAENYCFDGWDPEWKPTVLAEYCTPNTLVITYTAKWADDKNQNDIDDKLDEFKVVYDLDGGTTTNEATTFIGLKVGDATPKIADPTKEGYTFKEWQPTVADTVKAEDAKNSEDKLTITYKAIYTQNEQPPVEPETITIEYHANYKDADDVVVSEDSELPATIKHPDNVKKDDVAFSTSGQWKNETTGKTWKFIGWYTLPDKDTEGGTWYKEPPVAYNPAANDDQNGQDDAGNATIIDQQSMNPRSAGASSLATRAVLKTLAMAATSSKGDTPDLTLYAQWKEVVEPVEPNPHLTVTKTVDPEPAANKKFALDEEIVYKITVTNDGNVELGDIKVTDTLNVTVAEGESLEIKSLQPGESKTITVTYKVTQEDINRGSITNGATAEGKTPGSTEDIPVTPGEVTVPTNKPDDGGNTPGGGGGTRPPKEPDPVDPTDDPGEPIDDPDTPLAPGTIDDETEINDGDTPLAPGTIDEEAEIDDEATPLTPFTGDDRHTDVWAFLSVLSLAGIVLLGRKRREEE